MQRTDDRALFSFRRCRKLAARAVPGKTCRGFSETEIENPDAPVVANHDVVGLHVAVGDPLFVRRCHRICKRDRNLEKLVQRKSVFLDKLGEGFAVNELHREEVDACLFFDREDLNDVGVIERRDSLGFALEPRSTLVAFGQLGRENFESDLAVELGVLGQVDLALYARADLFKDVVVGEGLADHLRLRRNSTRSANCGQSGARGRGTPV